MLAVKVCTSCGAGKPLDDYYRHPAMADGYLGKCKECHKRDVKTNRRGRIEYYRAYDRSRADEITRLTARMEYAKSPQGATKLAAGATRWRQQNPAKRKAHIIVSNAIRDGKLTRMPCEICFSDNGQAHHSDYSKSLEVRWLCVGCHSLIHKSEREERRLRAVWGKGD